MLGYYCEPEATATAFRGGWFHSGDLAVMHADGYIEVRDRAKDIIISGGENISSLEVERVLYEHPAVLEAAIVAWPDEKWGEVPHAYVLIREDTVVSEQDLIEFCLTPLGFVRIHRSILVNTTLVRDLRRDNTGTYVLRTTDGSEHPVGRAYKGNLKVIARSWLGVDLV
jgi:fatty-acyl-CoA synthase